MKFHLSVHSLILIPPHRERGFTIVELMVAMTIGLLVLAGLFYFYIGASQSSRYQGALAQMQTNARYAFEIMGVDIRMAGFIGPEWNQTTIPITNVVNTPNPATLSSLIDLANPLIGYENTNPPNVCTTANTTACYLTTGKDSLTVVRADTENKYTLNSDSSLSYPTAPTAFTLSSWPASNPPQAGEIFVASNYTHAAVFQVQTATSSPVVSFATGTAQPGNSSTALGSFFGGINTISLYRLRGVSYYIGRNPVGEPALYRDRLIITTSGSNPKLDHGPEELVQGVQDMDITYGIDTSTDAANRDPFPGDGSVDDYWTAAQVNTGTGIQSAKCNANTNAHWRCVLSVRITLTLVSGQDEKVGTSGDKLLRKTFTNTIVIRNRLL